MTDHERQALLTLAIMAALDDGREDAPEHAERQRIAERTSLGGDVSASTIYQDVVRKRVTIDQATSVLVSPETKTLARMVDIRANACSEVLAGSPECSSQAALSIVTWNPSASS